MKILSKLPDNDLPGQPFAVISQHVLFERVAGEYVLLDLNSGEYFGLDGVGTRIFELIQSHPNLEAVLEVMLQEYDVDENRLRGELEEFVALLVSKGFLVTQDETDQ